MKQVNYKQIVLYLVVYIGMMIFFRYVPCSCYLLLGMAFYALLERRKTELCFLLLLAVTSMTIVNFVVFPRDMHWSLSTKLTVLLLGFGLMIKGSEKKTPTFAFPFYILFAYLAVMSFTSLFGWSPLISELKLLLFTGVMVAFMQAVALITRVQLNYPKIRSFVLMLAIFFVLGSVVVIPFPTIGRSLLYNQLMMFEDSAANEILQNQMYRLFNGMTWHSQTLGPLMALFNSFLLSDYLLNIQRRNFLYLLLLASIPVLIYMTSSRTAMGAYLASLTITIFFFLRARGVSLFKKRKVVGLSLLGVFFAGMLLVTSPAGIRNIEAFIRKAHDVDKMDSSKTLTDSFLGSRQWLLEQSIANFQKSPLMGNGFQVSEQMSVSTVSNLPSLLHASVEKGVIWSMLLEEGGFLGTSIFLVFMVCLYIVFLKKEYYCFLSTFTVYLIVNFGEAMFFSASGTGGVLWGICFAALLVDLEHEHSRQRRFSIFSQRRVSF